MDASAWVATTCGWWSRPCGLAIAFIFFSLALFPQAQPLTAHEQALAAKDEFYFLADLPGKMVSLKYHGAFLTSWPVQKVEVIAARIFFIKRVPHKFPEVFYIPDAVIQPPIDLPSPTIIPSTPEQEAAGTAPSAILPTMEELIKAPQDFYFLGDSPIRLRIHMPELPKNPLPQPRFAQSFINRVKDFFRGLVGDIDPTLILTLSNADGERIYRAFPEKVNVLVYLTPPVAEEIKK